MPPSTPADERPYREPARNDAGARRRFLAPLQRSLSAVSSSALWRVAPRPDGSYAAFTVPPVLPLPGERGDRLYLRSTIQFVYDDDRRFTGERKVVTEDYAHTVGTSEQLKPQLYSWEWSRSGSPYPHVHVRRADPEYHGLGKLHIPVMCALTNLITGRASARSLSPTSPLPARARRESD